jgi:demethylmenaquinone methyltransferase/2-methoxy-6-polyprenyl-1,4-benzoquinol methylase
MSALVTLEKMDDLLREQIAYYGARAAEYDADLKRLGRYSSLGGSVSGPDRLGESERQIRAIGAALLRLAPFEDVLELACGTGWWTQVLAAHADRVTAVDASEEMPALHRQRVPAQNVRRQKADLLGWKPTARYDLIFFLTGSLTCRKIASCLSGKSFATR